MIPFLKWPGGKRWFIHHHADVLPVQFERYIEPFLGGGSVFFHLRPKASILSDTNEELITTYRAIRDKGRLVAAALRGYHQEHDKEHYYKIRESCPKSPVLRAARMIYLNRTCFNGIYRVNLEGAFNVPKGTKTSVVLPSDDFERIGVLLSTADIRVSDFEPAIDEAGPNDLVFADPPYTVNHNNNGFIKYNEQLFSWADQQRLAATLARARDRGATIIATNADHSSVRRLYWRHDFSLRSVRRSSSISCTPNSRKHFQEIIIQASGRGAS
jgi:DNA adenine methylase